MGRKLFSIATLASALLGGAMLHAQLLPPVGDTIRGVTRLPGEVLGDITPPIERTLGSAGQLAADRLARLRLFAQRNADRIELDAEGQPAVRGEVIAVEPSDAILQAASRVGFAIARDERIEGLDIRSVTLRTPPGWSLKKAIAQLRKIAPGGNFTPNHISLPSGAAPDAPIEAPLATGSAGASPIGLIDGGVARHPAIGSAEQRGFASGAPAASSHGTAVASLIVGKGPVRGAYPGAGLLVADIYGRDPAGGNAVAIARALGWMSSRGVPVVTMSLVGPPNPLLSRAVTIVSAKGMQIVAPVGNDGAAAPPAYPASYPQAISVTGVDGRNRPLIEAGRARHLDYAAPGADMAAADPRGGLMAVRGTSFAAPLVAGRLASFYRTSDPAKRPIAVAALDREARDLGRRGADPVYGRGLICGDCRTLMR